MNDSAEKLSECFDKLSMNGKILRFSLPSPFALSPVEG